MVSHHANARSDDPELLCAQAKSQASFALTLASSRSWRTPNTDSARSIASAHRLSPIPRTGTNFAMARPTAFLSPVAS